MQPENLADWAVIIHLKVISLFLDGLCSSFMISSQVVHAKRMVSLSSAWSMTAFWATGYRILMRQLQLLYRDTFFRSFNGDMFSVNCSKGIMKYPTSSELLRNLPTFILSCRACYYLSTVRINDSSTNVCMRRQIVLWGTLKPYIRLCSSHRKPYTSG